MDGNNRWSKKNNKTLLNTYDSGAKKLLILTDYIFKNYECEYVSAFALSKDNLKRSKKVIDTVKKVLERYVDQFSSSNFKKKYNVKIIGDTSIFNKKIQNKIDKINEINLHYKKNLIIFFNYSGSDDIVMSLKKINRNNLKNNFNFGNFLLTKNIPDPDILLRTGDHKRLSDFMLFQIRYTELFFLKKLWPDCSKNDLYKIIKEYKQIQRNYGI